jgi:hypothetical protein
MTIMQTRDLFPRAALLAGALLLATAGAARAQVGTVDPLPYPGWVPSDRVAPAITVDVSYDSVTALWRYRYTAANGASAEQDLFNLTFRVSGPPASVTAPDGWIAVRGPAALYTAAEPGAIAFEAELPETPLDGLDAFPPSPSQVRPGTSLSGFELTSPYPPGTVRTYVQGWVATPIWDDADSVALEHNPEPVDSINSLRGWTLGPTRYTQLLTDGSRRPSVDGFLGFMNIAETTTVLRNPAPIALEFSVAGELVYRESFRAELNGVDVTASFFPGAADGADLVAVFQLGSSPLKVGKNILLTSVDGQIPGTLRRATDTDRMTFEVAP